MTLQYDMRMDGLTKNYGETIQPTKSLVITIVVIEATWETLLHVKSKGKWNASPNNSKFSSKPANNSANKELTCHHCGYRGHIQPDCQKKKRDNATKPPSTNLKFTSMTNGKTSSLDDWIVDGGCIGHMTYDKSILCDIKPHNSQIPIGDASTWSFMHV